MDTLSLVPATVLAVHTTSASFMALRWLSKTLQKWPSLPLFLVSSKGLLQGPDIPYSAEIDFLSHGPPEE